MPTKTSKSTQPDPQPESERNPYAAEEAEIVETRATKNDAFSEFADELVKSLEVGSKIGKRFNTQPGDKQSTIRHKLNRAAKVNGVRVRCVVKENADGTFQFGVRALKAKDSDEENGDE